MVTSAKIGILQVWQLKHVKCNESVFVVLFQASALLHKMHTLQLSRKYVKSITPERKAQVGLHMLSYVLNNVPNVWLQMYNKIIHLSLTV